MSRVRTWHYKLSLMYLNTSILFFFVLPSIVDNVKQFIFLRNIEAVGIPYYKILLSIGDCKENILYFEKKVWPQLRMNRVYDIYYESENYNMKVSRVELRLIINDTACQAYSKNGVGGREFAATLFLPTNLGTVFYTMTVYTCSKHTFENKTNEEGFQMLPFYVKRRVIKYFNKVTTRLTDGNRPIHTKCALGWMFTLYHGSCIKTHVSPANSIISLDKAFLKAIDK